VSITIEHNDILTWCKRYGGGPYHAILCDPPYEMSFMNSKWDNTGIAFQPATWAALAEHLYPGAFGMAFASSRGWHRMAVAIEDAGLIIHPTIFLWGYGSGFPKATRIDTQIDNTARAEREVIPNPLAWKQRESGKYTYGTRAANETLSLPATPLARAWAGHRYGLQAIKPAVEPIIVFQKRYVGRPVDCITSTGAGALNIDRGRINPGETVPGGGASWGASTGTHEGWKRPAHQNYEPSDSHTMGRWPSNLCLAHDFECTADVCTESCAVRMIGEQSGELSSGGPAKTRQRIDRFFGGLASMPDNPETYNGGDSGTAARFYFNSDWMYERLEQSDPVKYEAKASTSEREAGLDDFASTTVGDGRQKSIDNAYQRGETARRNSHPTVKPISLAIWLAKLLAPPEMYAPRRLLVPFSGSGSEVAGALLSGGWEHITGIEREQEYVALARARIAWWQRQQLRLQTSDPETILEQARVLTNEQLGLFE
jgi:hypothetical protein